MQKFKKIALSSLLPNPKNPRKDLKPGDSEYAKIKTSIEQFQFLDPIIFNTRTFKVIGGHQRLKILQETGITDLFIINIGAYSWAFSDADLKELSPQMESAANIALNKAQGDWNIDQLVLNLQEIKTDGMDISITGFDDAGFNQMVENLNGLVIDDPSKEWQGMPEFNQEERRGIREIIIHFDTQDDIKTFSALIGQNITDKTKYIWFPEKERRNLKGSEYLNET